VSARGAVLFPGQGSQALGMGLDQAAADPAAAAMLALAESTLGLPLRAILGGTDGAALDRTDVCQPAILAVSLAAMASLERRGLIRREQVVGVAGLSLGEYSALAWAGALTPVAALRLVRLRGEAMQRASEERPSGMLSLVGATEAAAQALCDEASGDGVLVVANLLGPSQIAVSGTREALERAQGLLAKHGIRKAVPLPVAGAFHSPCMASAATALNEALSKTEIARPGVPVVMNVSAEPTDDPATIRDLLARQLTAPVKWHASLSALFALGCECVLEPAPGRQLTNMLKRGERPVTVTTCANAAELSAFEAWPARGAQVPA
jgi:[acyl-carrier-protein] S-malonyltransferase